MSFESRAGSLTTAPFQTTSSFGCFLLNAGVNDLTEVVISAVSSENIETLAFPLVGPGEVASLNSPVIATEGITIAWCHFDFKGKKPDVRASGCGVVGGAGCHAVVEAR
jgi:hypothetical protein